MEMMVLILLTGLTIFANWLNVNIYQSRPSKRWGKSFLNGHRPTLVWLLETLKCWGFSSGCKPPQGEALVQGFGEGGGRVVSAEGET